MKHYRNRPLFGVSGPDEGGLVLWWCTKIALRMSGAKVRRITPATPYILDAFDGFVISGGGDIDPRHYGQEDMFLGASYDAKRDTLERHIIHHAITHKKPLLGICRGMQMLNITLGGTLHQEAKDVLEDFLPNKSLISKIIGRRDVVIAQDSQLYNILAEEKHCSVNSIHHQAVDELGEGLCVVATEKNTLVQAIEHNSELSHPFLIGLQWHPELMLYSAHARRLFAHLVDKARVTS